MKQFSQFVSFTFAGTLLFGFVTAETLRGADAAPQVELKLLAEGFTAPIALTSLPDGSGRLIVADQAGFVQVMKVRGVDRTKVERLDATFDEFASMRPDLLGGLRVWTGPDSYIEAAYFTSEAEARAGERTELPEAVQAIMAEFQEMMANTEFIDLKDPDLH